MTIKEDIRSQVKLQSNEITKIKDHHSRQVSAVISQLTGIKNHQDKIMKELESQKEHILGLQKFVEKVQGRGSPSPNRKEKEMSSSERRGTILGRELKIDMSKLAVDNQSESMSVSETSFTHNDIKTYDARDTLLGRGSVAQIKQTKDERVTVFDQNIKVAMPTNNIIEISLRKPQRETKAMDES
jgi:hypothetical protein